MPRLIEQALNPGIMRILDSFNKVPLKIQVQILRTNDVIRISRIDMSDSNMTMIDGLPRRPQSGVLVVQKPRELRRQGPERVLWHELTWRRRSEGSHACFGGVRQDSFVEDVRFS